MPSFQRSLTSVRSPVRPGTNMDGGETPFYRPSKGHATRKVIKNLSLCPDNKISAIVLYCRHLLK